MESTQAQAHASHCVITRVPVEIIAQTLQEDVLSTGDYAALASTCRYLRAIATPLLFRSLSFEVRDRSSFASVEAVAESENKGALVRIVEIIELHRNRVILSVEAKVYSGILVSALGVMSALTTLEIPFATLDRPVFDAIYRLETLARLALSPITFLQCALDLDDRRPNDPLRRSPLVVTLLRCPDPDHLPADPFWDCVEDLLWFFGFHRVQVDQVRLEPFSLFEPEPPTSFLTVEAFPNLVHLDVACFPHRFEDTVDWFTAVLNTQVFLKTVTFEVLEYLEGFELGARTWIGLPNGRPSPPSPELALAWAGTRARDVTLGYERVVDEDDEDEQDGEDDKEDGRWRLSSVELVLSNDSVVTPRQIRALAQEACPSASLCIHTVDRKAALGWTDWPATVAALRSRSWYGWLSLQTSVTPTATISTTIACSATCYATLLEMHPAIHAACELVGGPAALWTLAVNLNIERLRLILQGDVVHLVPDVHMLVRGAKGDLVEIEGTVSIVTNEGRIEATTDLVLVDIAPKRAIEDKLLDCECFGCSDGLDEDPISAIRRCGVKEVRAALAIGGFNLDAFDKRPPTEPIDPDSFETFLRSKA